MDYGKKMKTVEDIIREVQKSKGKSTGWPSDFEYNVKDGNVEITLKKSSIKKILEDWILGG